MAAGVDDLSGYLSTQGNQIVNADGQAVKLSGVSWFGMETSRFLPDGLHARGFKSMIDQMAELGFNSLRIPISSEIMDPESQTGYFQPYLSPELIGLSPIEVLDQIISYAGEVGIKVILDHHRSNANENGGAQENGLWYTPTFTEERWIADWVALAERYAGNPTVICAELQNEPFGATWGDNSVKDWAAAAERAGNAIQAVNPGWLIFVEGIRTYQGQSYWDGGNLMGVKDRPVVLDLPNKVVYTAHDYPASVFNQPWFNGPEYPENLSDKFREAWGYIYEQNIAPVWVSEFGSRLQGDQPKDLQWFTEITRYLAGDLDTDGDIDIAAGSEGISWNWWAWNPNSGDTGGILKDDFAGVHVHKLSGLQPLQGELFPSTYSVTDYGSAGVDNIAGSLFGDVFDGLGGNDLIDGAAGNDVLTGGEGDDLIDGGSGDDVIYGGVGSDTIGKMSSGGAGADRLFGGEGNDTIVSIDTPTLSTDGPVRPELDLVEGGPGDDNIIGGRLDNLDGGAGFDRLTLDFSFNGVDFAHPVRINFDAFGIGTANDGTRMVGFEELYFKLTDGDDTVNSDHAPAQIEAGGGNDSISTGNGNDAVNGGRGADTISTRAGNDVVAGGEGNDAINGGNGTDAAVYRGSILDYRLMFLADGILEVSDLRAGFPDGSDILTGIETLKFADIEIGTPERIELMGDGTSDAVGTVGRDFVYGNAGANSFIGGAGEDVFLGGEGADTAIFYSLRSNHTLSTQNGLTLVTSAGEGRNVLSSVETIRYLDGELSFAVAGSPAQIYRLYDSAFNRAPDSAGFNGWVDRLDGGTSLGTVAAAFAGSAEFQTTYGSLTERGFVEQLYRNVLGREGDAAGVSDWLARLNSGTQTRADVLVGFSESAEHIEILRAPVEAGLWDPRDATHSGTGDADNLIGTAVGDYMLGLDGNDTLFGGAGDDLIDGGTGSDTAVFTAFRRPADIVELQGARIVSGLGADGTDTLMGIERLSFHDGAIVADVGSNIAAVFRMYDSAFNRGADSFGLNGWASQLDRGALTIVDVANGFTASQEFQNTYGNLDDSAFVELLYQNVLGRASDSGGKAGWVNVLASGQSDRGGVLVGFSESAEHIEATRADVQKGLWDVDDNAAIAARFYFAAFDRLPDAGGLVGWTAALDAGTPIGSVADGFTNSAEFQNTYGALDDDGFVELLYQNVLNRASDPGGKAGWTNLLASGTADRGDVLFGFSESAEHQADTFYLLDDGFMLA